MFLAKNPWSLFCYSYLQLVFQSVIVRSEMLLNTSLMNIIK